MRDGDTLAAIATPPGNGGVGIIRLSGPLAEPIARSLSGKRPKPRYAHFRHFRDADGKLIDSGLLLYFPAPQSFTGEDIVELHGHGGSVILDMLMRRVLELGARPANPGEFSQRAFLNGKIDLAQAEAIADLISAGTEHAVRSAQQSLQGVFSRHIHHLTDELIELRVYIEAAIDFVDEAIDFLGDGVVANRIVQLQQRLHQILATARQGRLLHDGISVALAGKPNVGKSSLLNALAGFDAAIVTDIAGTTRDVLRERIQIDGMPLHIIDTAGLRNSDNIVEQEGIRRAHLEIEKADKILLLLDSTAQTETDPVDDTLIDSNRAITRIFNKIDISGVPPQILETPQGTSIYLSAKTGAGLDLLQQHLKQSVGFGETQENTFVARRRHITALENALASVNQAANQMQHHAHELVAEELKLAQNSLGTITGEFSTDDLLGEIFGSFCIGK
ncbi:MAG: tRNA uridine-5-carboxymethylaminomethyl(34) synthesis GTPase MnmE [Methylomonas sp.]|nr:tRNA uridine-5-carboxymethylaminomethyl(34) synthesis GTPase MnmE [Methylomonas sp.]PPD22571.1 MAG: tRNA uridine-5-carboxymethylaminomethyl(34) synthesis GTPase MnmE [Methylomonas sp.]PPD27882.1 MAG: tRNA uridine-5-carboxymethylaminomethyl(34) synthesis GTPase MnmE [Methylomonas sp.]PPD38087.1 MAG: tRNA uridine-5-carboxymethylaminomethyl(34) synthesis GTPase MnmE [Methylomonas sp.]PPD39992.1 MAG: tRNA uridine-5-carboxymethylaminomethyl(34) synthesis GTPase MnmE [Methylomonas sp.]